MVRPKPREMVLQQLDVGGAHLRGTFPTNHVATPLWVRAVPPAHRSKSQGQPNPPEWQTRPVTAYPDIPSYKGTMGSPHGSA